MLGDECSVVSIIKKGCGHGGVEKKGGHQKWNTSHLDPVLGEISGGSTGKVPNSPHLSVCGKGASWSGYCCRHSLACLPPGIHSFSALLEFCISFHVGNAGEVKKGYARYGTWGWTAGLGLLHLKTSSGSAVRARVMHAWHLSKKPCLSVLGLTV